MKNLTKVVIFAGLLTGLGTSGIAAIAKAKPSTMHSRSQIAQTQNQQKGAKEMREDGANEGPESEHEGPEDLKEAAQLKSLAKITPEQAQQAAEAEGNGKATMVKLDNDDGNLVYEVKVGNKEIVVDAGNGRILKVEGAHEEENNATEARTPKSSIQVPGGDQDQHEQDESGGIQK